MSSATQNCEFCGSPAHVWFNCTKKPAGWKPDRLKSTGRTIEAAKVTTPARTLADRRGGSERPPAAVPPASRKAVAKKVGQADQEASVEPPVDTLKKAEAAAAHLKPKRKGNRHRPGYHTEYMRKRRAKT